MEKTEARAILESSLAPLRPCPYRDLLRYLHEPRTRWVSAPSGAEYQVEISAVWDDKDAGHLRVMAAVDDAGVSAFVPLTDDFIKSNNGRLVGE